MQVQITLISRLIGVTDWERTRNIYKFIGHFNVLGHIKLHLNAKSLVKVELAHTFVTRKSSIAEVTVLTKC